MVNARQSKIDDVTIEMHNLIVGQNDVDLLKLLSTLTQKGRPPGRPSA